ncbi:hypothetical protein [Mucilaginibacter terrae]|uniref:Agarase n=1 Tax=Mucilaginibacter terrae TaxID=1955052 RepID=A0ABU3GQM8_9SPHI|nr:hypothetical protein [Mucilaginibacter terrae]MDT3401935.1 hypothetical protein [Mucilaginibacter terrae]
MIYKSILKIVAVLTALPLVLNAQTTAEYSLKVSAKISKQGSGKPGFSEWKEYPTRTIKTLDGYTDNKVRLDNYCGRTDKKAKATGFYYVTQINGRWWSVDPLGNLFICVGMNSVQIGTSDRNKIAFDKNFSSVADWAVKTSSMLNEYGFNACGAWSNYKELRSIKPDKKVAYTVMLDFMGSYGRKKGAFQESGHLGYPDNTIFVFDPEFETYANEYAKQITDNAGDKNLYGYFSDNEMPFRRLTLDSYLGKKDTTDAGFQAATKWLNERKLTQTDITDQVRNEFLGFVVDRYFSIVSKAIRKNDPNHMYLGCRFHSYEKNVPEVFKAAGKYVDVISVNYYNEWTPQAKHLDNWTSWSGRPVIITEWYVKGEDSGMGNYSGAGWVVKTQEDRGLFYQNFTLGLLESGNCVGWHWFKYQDNDPTNTKVDPSNTDANKGILDNEYQAYKPLVQKMQELNNAVYSLTDYFDKRRK